MQISRASLNGALKSTLLIGDIAVYKHCFYYSNL